MSIFDGRLQLYGFGYVFYRHKGQLLGTISEEEVSHFPIVGYGSKKTGLIPVQILCTSEM